MTTTKTIASVNIDPAARRGLRIAASILGLHMITLLDTMLHDYALAGYPGLDAGCVRGQKTMSVTPALKDRLKQHSRSAGAPVARVLTGAIWSWLEKNNPTVIELVRDGAEKETPGA